MGALIAKEMTAIGIWLNHSDAPDQDTLKQMMQKAEFTRCDYTNLTNGIVAVHRGYKPRCRGIKKGRFYDIQQAMCKTVLFFINQALKLDGDYQTLLKPIVGKVPVTVKPLN